MYHRLLLYQTRQGFRGAQRPSPPTHRLSRAGKKLLCGCVLVYMTRSHSAELRRYPARRTGRLHSHRREEPPPCADDRAGRRLVGRRGHTCGDSVEMAGQGYSR